jgi:hypothetical protein
MSVIVGMISTADGSCMKRTAELSPSGRGATEYRDYYASPAVEYRSTQPAWVPVDIDHVDPVVGQVRFLALRGHGLFGVLEVDDEVAAELQGERFHLSPDINGHRRDNRFSDIELNAVAIVERTAVIAQQPAAVVIGNLTDAHLYHANPNRSLLRAAAAYHEQRQLRGRQPHRIDGARDVEQRVADRPPTYGPIPSDSEPGAYRRPRGRMITLPDGHVAELEFSAPVGSILAVR